VTVLSFYAWKIFDVILDMDEPCPGQFHNDKYVYQSEDVDVCFRCNVKVTLSDHPSLKKPTWRG
jgi:hypothetical protein